MKAGLILCACAAVLLSCGSAGSGLLEFDAFAAGPADIAANQPLKFRNGRGYAITLERATLWMGALYLNRSRPSAGAQETSCIQPGIYMLEVREGLRVNLLDPNPQQFPRRGNGTEDPAVNGEIWLLGPNNDVNAQEDPTVIMEAAGVAEKDGVRWPFEARFTIGGNRAIPQRDPFRPGADPMCKQRIITGIAADFTPRDGGGLLVRADPRAWFRNVEFAELQADPEKPGQYRFLDRSEGQPNIALYEGLRANTGVYEFTWRSPGTP
ncbi:MAG: hypothetical protein GMKNLPBB_01195 [Myxococcota bacterium]|nr:hypothetical protein [Myxococcota bacterium]